LLRGNGQRNQSQRESGEQVKLQTPRFP